MKQAVNQYQFEKISRNMAKQFGVIPKGEEGSYSMILFPMESNILKKHRLMPEATEHSLLEAIRIALFTIDSRLNETTCELDPFITKENELFTKALLQAIDPFSQPNLHKALSNDYDLTNLQQLNRLYTTPIKCLLLIERSVDFWVKSSGIKGYFKMLERFIGTKVEEDDIMDFTFELVNED